MALESRTPSILRFGTFEVDVRAGEVRKQGGRIKLQEQPFQVLAVLLQRPGEVVTREELRSQIWPDDTFVDFDNSLNTAINKLRDALGDSADNPRFIETLPRRGYRFLAPVSGLEGKEEAETLAPTHPAKVAVPPADAQLKLKHSYGFGSYQLDAEERVLLKDGQPVTLAPKDLETLLVLVKRAGHIVEKEELLEKVWPGVFVEEGNLARHIFNLRQLLGDTPDGLKYIETIPKRGYRFLAPIVSDQQKESPVRAARWRFAAALVLVGAFTVAMLLWHVGKARPLTEKDTIVLADFANTTGDPVFDDTLRQGLRVQLEQSPFLNILSDQKVSEELHLMERPKDERLTPAIAREVCQRAGSKALLTGSISSLGAHYVVGLNAWNCETGDTLDSAQLETESKERVLKALSDAATAMREKLGESLATIQKYDAPLEATTPSLEALQAYTLGMKTLYAKGSAAAIPFFQHAVQLDPGFAMAYGKTGVAYSNIGEDASATENAHRGYELREKVSERERLYLESHYYDIVTGDLEKAVQVDELWHQIYPRDSEPVHNLIMIYSGLSKFDDALQKANEAVRLDPREADGEDFYLSIVPIHIFLNRFDKAEVLLKQARERKVESANLLSLRYMLAFMRNDEREMERLVASAAGSPRMESILRDDEACSKAYHGQLKQAREAFQKAIASAGYNKENRELAAILRGDASLTEAYLGDAQHARAHADGALKLTVNRYVEVHATLALALAGETTRAEKLVAELNKDFPSDTELQRYWLPTIRAAAALQRGDAEKVADLLAPIGSYEITPYAMYFPLGQVDSTYVRGWASLAMHNGSAAAAQFQKILNHTGLAEISPVGALARLGLSRAYAMQEDTAKARAAYQDFLTLWKDADPDIPILQQAKAEYANLH